MKGLLISTALLVSSNAFANYSAKIVGGDDAGTDYPWVAGLHTYSPGTSMYGPIPFCGGTLISPGWVVTAAHCLVSKGPNSILLRINQPDLKENGNYIAPGYTADAVVLHENYVSHTSGYDIALVKLTSKLDQPTASLADEAIVSVIENEPFPDDTLRALGWGIFDNENFNPENAGSGDHPDTLQSVVLDYLPASQLASPKPDNIVIAYEPEPSDDQPFGADTCYGDSGGPLMLREDNIFIDESELGPILVGITSYGSTNCNSTSSVGIYTRVSAYTEWIEQQAGAHGDPLADLTVNLSHPTRDLQTGSTSDDLLLTVLNQSHVTEVSTFRVTLTPSSGVSLSAGTGSALTCSAGTGGSLICQPNGLTLGAGGSVTVPFSATDTSSSTRKAKINAEIVSMDQDEYRLFNNSSDLNLRYANGADLDISLRRNYSSDGEFTISVINRSDLFTAFDALITLDITPAITPTLPQECTRIDDIRIECAIGEIAPDGEFSRTMRLTETRRTWQKYAVAASVSHSGDDPNKYNDSDTGLSHLYPAVVSDPHRPSTSLSSSSSSGGAAIFLLGLLLWPGLRRLSQHR